MKSKKALTYIEILLSALLLVTTLAGLLASIFSTRTAVERTERRINAYNTGRQILDQLYAAVNGTTYDTGILADGSSTSGFVLRDGVQYNWTISVSTVSGLRRAEANVTIPEF